MRPWNRSFGCLLHSPSSYSYLPLSKRASPFTRRLFTTHSHERITVTSGPDRPISVDLYNLKFHSSTSPVFIHLPAYPQDGDSAVEPPDCLQDGPVASINYQWRYPQAGLRGDPEISSGIWPAPLEDVKSAYAWVRDNLAPPPGQEKRDIYVYGSYLGATLAMSLALHTCKPGEAFATRGVVAYNGIYNWTMFLPDHNVNWVGKNGKVTWPPPETSRMRQFHEALPYLFGAPEDMFDARASPALIFRKPGLRIPPSFYVPSKITAMPEVFTGKEMHPRIDRYRAAELAAPTVRLAHIRVPRTLLLYDSPIMFGGEKWNMRYKGNGFSMQAKQMELMLRKRSLEFLQRRGEADPALHWLGGHAAFPVRVKRRVSCYPVGEKRENMVLDGAAQGMVLNWLRAKSRQARD